MVSQPSWLSRNEIFRSTPVTVTIIALWMVGFLADFLTVPWAPLFAFDPAHPITSVTGLVTYPLAGGGGLFGLLLNSLVLWWFGGSLERSWHSRSYLLFLVVTTIAAALVWEIGLWGFKLGLMPLATPWLLLSSTVVAWAWLNPGQTIMLWFVLPLQARWLAWLDIALLYFTFPTMVTNNGLLRLALGLFALGGVGAAWLFTQHRRTWGWIPRKSTPKQPGRLHHPASHPFGGLRRLWQEYQRRRRIAHLQKTIKFDD
jgi:hypothetical protein